MKAPPSQSSHVLHRPSQELNEKRKPSIKPNIGRFDSFVARYCPAVYNFAFRLTDDPRGAVLLTHRAFNSIRKELWLCRDEVALVRILLKAVVRVLMKLHPEFPKNNSEMKASIL